MVSASRFIKQLVLLLAIAGSISTANAALNKLPGYAETFGLAPEQVAKTYTVQEIAASVPANVLWPGETASFTLQFTNKTDAPINVTGKLEIIRYATETNPADVFIQRVFKLADIGSEPLKVSIPAKSYADITVKPALPEQFGPYALVVDLPGNGRVMAVECVRVPAAVPGKVQYPSYALDLQTDSFQEMAMFKRLGIKGMRMEWGYIPTTSREFWPMFYRLAGRMKFCEENNITVMITSGGGGPQPMGIMPRPYLDNNDVMLNDGKGDMAWLPEGDDDYQKYCKIVAGTFGWPRGPLNAMELWNEPWEGRSISGWGADMLRYREIFTRMAQGIEEARKESGVQVLIGGTCSSMNTFDKLFAEGIDSPFLKWLDFTSIHYQPLGAVPALEPAFMTRKSPYGPVRVWDTESWVANSEERVAAVIASMRAQGQSRTAGVYHDNTREIQNIRYQSPGGLIQTTVVQALPPAAAIAATQSFIGERQFKEILFKNGLPWVFTFDGLPKNGKPNPDDGTLVVVGDLGGVYERDYLLFRSAHGMKNNEMLSALQAQLNALPANASAAERQKIQKAMKSAEVLDGATMTLENNGGQIVLFDFYGNPLPAKDGKITVPLNGLGYFLRTDGSPGSFAALQEAVKSAKIDGIEPLDVAAHDMTARVNGGATLRLTLTNVLNRPINGKLTMKLGDLIVEPATQELAFTPFQTMDVNVKVSGKSTTDNSYPMSLVFDAGKDGKSARSEMMHVNAIAKRTINVDGKLDDWQDVLPQPVAGKDIANPNLTEKAWFPFEKLDSPVGKGFGIGYMAYDDNYFYFAAKIADDTPYDGTVRFATRDDDAYFYPAKSYQVDADKTLESKPYTFESKSWTMSNLAKDERALLKPGSKERVVGGWEATFKAFAIDLNFTDGKAHQVAFYAVDGEAMARRNMRIEIVDQATGKSLAKQDMAGFDNGKYAVFNVSGNVRIKFIANNWLSSTINGFFFDPATPAQPLTGNAAAFVKFDETTKGNWQGVYGAEGYNVIGAEEKYPAYAEVKVPADVNKKELVWPEGVRRYSYRKGPDIPSGSGTDNVQIAFNVIPVGQDGWYANPPGTMPRFMNYRDTDYEYALNQVSPKYGGGTEIWRLFAPGMVRKHFFPRQPKSEKADGGPVENGKLSIVRDEKSRVVECALPWSEIPDVKKALDAGQPIKFSFRVNDNGRIPAYELAQGRSVSKLNNYAFHNDWESAWANEVEFGFEK